MRCDAPASRVKQIVKHVMPLLNRWRGDIAEGNRGFEKSREKNLAVGDPSRDLAPSLLGRILKWPTRGDCKSPGLRLLWFESRSYHHFPPLTATRGKKLRPRWLASGESRVWFVTNPRNSPPAPDFSPVFGHQTFRHGSNRLLLHETTVSFPSRFETSVVVWPFSQCVAGRFGDRRAVVLRRRPTPQYFDICRASRHAGY